MLNVRSFGKLNVRSLLKRHGSPNDLVKNSEDLTIIHYVRQPGMPVLSFVPGQDASELEQKSGP